MLKLDVKEYIRQWLPPGRRTAKLLQFLDALATPLAELWNGFNDWRTKQYYELNITGQTYALQEHLNETFDNVQRRIYIAHYNEQSLAFPLEAEGYEGVFISLESEDSGQFIALQGEVQEAIGVSFQVYAPAELNIELIKVELYKYKLAGRSFSIIEN